MLPVDQHISELLYEHDCVIVPSLGGFLASNVQAKVNPGQHSILPPRRKIAFNIYLRQNDGLLANHIVEYERLSYAEALRRIELYVQECFHKLDQQEKVIVERVGTIYYDKEKHLLFEPFRHAQFRKDAFGLGTLQFSPVQRDDSGSRLETQRRELMKNRDSVKAGRKPVRIKYLNYKILGVLGIAGTLLWFSFNLFLLKPGGGNQGSLNPFTQDSGTENPKTNILPDTRTDVKKESQQQAETVFVASAEPVPNKTEIIAPTVTEIKTQEKETKAANVTEQNQSPQNEQYYIIAGVFRIAENAESLNSSLQEKGFKNTRIIRRGKLNYVSYDSFGDHTSAIAMLDSLRKQQAEGWIWHN